MNPVIEALLAALLLVASFFTLVGSLGLVKLSEFFRRLHGPTKSTTMGVGCVLIVSIFYHAMVGNSFHPRELLISVFLFITAPISAHMMAKAALSLRLKKRPQCPADETPDPSEDDSAQKSEPI
ncbi:Na+/H+ antiporter subunit G [Xanthomonadaceae bacterium XH05]|nr:Na+/H+ antiporter subunit G [Xanthomonadaceae bacterium XH05]